MCDWEEIAPFKTVSPNNASLKPFQVSMAGLIKLSLFIGVFEFPHLPLCNTSSQRLGEFVFKEFLIQTHLILLILVLYMLNH